MTTIVPVIAMAKTIADNVPNSGITPEIIRVPVADGSVAKAVAVTKSMRD